MGICGRHISKSELVRLQEMINTNKHLSRTQLSKVICQEFKLISPNGKLKDVGCRKELLKYERAGILQLPPAQQRSGCSVHTSSNQIKDWVAELPEVQCDFSDFGEVAIEKINSRYSTAFKI